MAGSSNIQNRLLKSLWTGVSDCWEDYGGILAIFEEYLEGYYRGPAIKEGFLWKVSGLALKSIWRVIKLD